MPDFNNRGGNRFSGGKGKFGGKSFGKPFGKPGGSRGGDRPLTLHKARCAECSKECEVPFRPVDGRPVYCKDCFAGRGGGEERFPARTDRREFPKRPFEARPKPFAPAHDDGVKRELQNVNQKLDRLISAIENLAATQTAPAPKKAAKKTAKKK